MLSSIPATCRVLTSTLFISYQHPSCSPKQYALLTTPHTFLSRQQLPATLRTLKPRSNSHLFDTAAHCRILLHLQEPLRRPAAQSYCCHKAWAGRGSARLAAKLAGSTGSSAECSNRARRRRCCTEAQTGRCDALRGRY